MKITEVEGILMSYCFAEPLRFPFWGGERLIFKRDAMVIRIRADNGLVGYGPGPAHERAVNEIRNRIRPSLLGVDPRRLNKGGFKGDSELLKIFAAVELAVLDLVAKEEVCPAYELLGGKERDRIKLYGSAGMYMTPEGYAAEASAVAEAGFAAYKMRPALGPEKDLETIRKIREAEGKLGIMIDAHSWWRMGDKSYSASTVRDLAKDLSQFDPVWLEEPLPPDDHESYRHLRKDRFLPIASGEHEQEDAGLLDLVHCSAVDYLQMDICCQGGIDTAQKVFQEVRKAGIKFAFHSWGTALEVLAAAHLGVCWPETVVEWLEYPFYSHGKGPGMYPFPLASELLREPLNIEHGDLILPTKPGWGIEVDESVFDRYPFKSGAWSTFRIDSPPQTIAVTGDHSLKWTDEDQIEDKKLTKKTK